MKRGLAGAVRAVVMARKTAMSSNDDDNHDNCDDSNNDNDRPQRVKCYLKLRCAANTQVTELVGATCRTHRPYCSEANPNLVWLPPGQCVRRRPEAAMVGLSEKCAV
jgi:hypothetical protein